MVTLLEIVWSDDAMRRQTSFTNRPEGFRQAKLFFLETSNSPIERPETFPFHRFIECSRNAPQKGVVNKPEIVWLVLSPSFERPFVARREGVS